MRLSKCFINPAWLFNRAPMGRPFRTMARDSRSHVFIQALSSGDEADFTSRDLFAFLGQSQCVGTLPSPGPAEKQSKPTSAGKVR